MGYQINRQALPALHSTTEPDICPGGSRPAVTGRGDSMRLAIAGIWQGMARET